MPLRLRQERGIYLASKQEIISPLVYFDMWVYLKIIQDKKAYKQITSLFNEDFGTLCLSLIALYEIVRRKREIICEIVKFISDMPFVLFDDDMLNDSILLPLDIFTKSGIDNFDQQDLNKILFAFKGTSVVLKKGQEDIVSQFNEIKANHCKIDLMIKPYKRHEKNKVKYTAKEILNIWFGYVLNKKEMCINENDVRDTYHLCKSSVHCDIVTTDSSWRAFIDETFPKLSDKIITDKDGLGIQSLIKKIQNYRE